MINIITGRVNSGKTTRLIEVYNSTGNGDGFFNRKLYEDGKYIGQEIVRLSDGESRVWSLKGRTPDDWLPEFTYGDYSFSGEGLQFAHMIIDSINKFSLEPVFIDEIGPLELQNKGFHDLFNLCLQSGREVYAVVRESCLKAVLEKYEIQDCKILYPNN